MSDRDELRELEELAALEAKVSGSPEVSALPQGQPVGNRKYNTSQPTAQYLLDKIKGDYSNMVGFPVDMITAGLNKLGTNIQNPTYGSQQLKNISGYQGLKPPSQEVELGGEIASNIAQSVPFAGYAGATRGVMPAVSELLGGLGMGAGGGMADMVAPNNDLAKLAGQGLGGAYGFRAGNLVQELNKAWIAKSGANEAARAAIFDSSRKQVVGDIQKAMASSDPQQITQAISRYNELKQNFPGIEMGVGEITNIDALRSMQREAAAKNLESLAESGVRSRSNESIIANSKGLLVPHTNESINSVINTQRRALHGQASEVDNELARLDSLNNQRQMQLMSKAQTLPNVGEKLNDIRQQEFTVSQAKANDLYNAFRQDLGPQGAKPVEATNILDTISSLRKEDPAAQRMPSLFNTTQSLVRVEPKAGLVNSSGQPIGKPDIGQLSVDDLLSLQKATRKDIRLAGAQSPPDRELTRRLNILESDINNTIRNNLPGKTLGLYDQARDYYANQHVPRFFEGTNYKQALPNIYGDLRIVPEKLVDEYAKNSTNAKHFMDLYGNSEPAKAAMQAGFIEKYTNEVLAKGGGERLHAAFMQRNKESLNEFPWIKDQFVTEGLANISVAQQQSILREKAQEIANSRLASVVGQDNVADVINKAMESPRNMGNFISGMPKPQRKAVVTAVMDRGWNILQNNGSDAFEKWVADNKNTIRTSITASYGRDIADQEFNNIRDLIDVTRLIERNPVQNMSTQAVRQAEDPLKESIGMGFSSILASARAMAQRRVSPEYTGSLFVGSYLSKLRKDEYLQLVRQTLYEPDTLQAFVNATKSNKKTDYDLVASKAADIFHTILGKGVGTQLSRRIPQLFGSSYSNQPNQQQGE